MLAVIALALVAACARGGGAGRGGLPVWLLKPEVPPGMDLELVFHHNNLGVAHLEQHHYGEAAREFEKVLQALPGWAEGHLNLGIAALNLHDSQRAEKEFRATLEISPRHPYAHYGLGLVLKQAGKSAQALVEFGLVLKIDPGDPDTLYNLGLLYAREGKHEHAVSSLRRVLGVQPANVSARFRLATSLLALGRKGEGNREMAEFQKLKEAGVGITMGLQYTEQGKYSWALADYRAFGKAAGEGPGRRVRFVEVPAAESGIAFTHGGEGRPPLAVDSAAPEPALLCSYGPGIAISDFDSDGDPDLFIPNCSGDGTAAPAALLKNDGHGRFSEAIQEAGLAGAGSRVAAAFGDYDNDGHPDLYLTGPGGNLLYRNRGDGTFKDVTGPAGVSGSGWSLAPAWADADHDGDLDLVVARIGAGAEKRPAPAPLLFFNNNGDGTFKEVAAEKRVDRPVSAVAVAFSDLDDDRDTDFVVSTLSGPVIAFSNDRIGTFTALSGGAGLPRQGRGEGVTLGDLDNDGWTDLFSPGSGWFRNLEGHGFAAPAGVGPAPGALGSAALDYDNDGDLDLVVAGKTLTLLRNEGGQFVEASGEAGLDRVAPGAARGVIAADLDSDGDPDLVVARNGAAPLVLRNDGGNLNRWVRIAMKGLHSNRFGVGTKVEVHSGSRFQRREVRLGNGYLTQEPEAILFGLGRRGLVDFVRFLWPGGVLQSELEVSAGQTVEISELDRKGSSCPLIFAWAGKSYRFITDFLGVGGIGFLVKPGVYGQPDPDEYVKIESTQLQPRDGYYLLQILENLEEVSYLDEAKLWVVDHPADLSVYPNERFGGGGPPPFVLFGYRKPLFPVSARDDDGRDVLSELMKVDRTYPDRFPLLERLPGYAEPHVLTLDFGETIRGKENLVLFLYGWTDYGYSSTNLAASQAGIDLTSPRLEAMGTEGEWETLVEDMGFPAGMPRMMTVDLRDRGPFTDGRFRIATSMRVYWDQVFLAEVEKDAATKITKLPVSYADLHQRGYPREHSPDGRQPLLYDYNLMDRTFPFRNLAGSYTRFGSVTELLREADDRFVVFGRGEELTLKFKADRLPHLPRGWKRDFLLQADGYCKDMDPNTAFPDTVEPLPFHAMSAYPYPEGERFPDDPAHVQYLRKYNTRQVSGRP